MRKPAVVVAVAVSAVLAGGVMVATTAGAETSAEVPFLPAAGAPGVPDLPQLPDGADLTGVPDLPGTQPAAGEAPVTATETRQPARPGGHQAAPPADVAPADVAPGDSTPAVPPTVPPATKAAAARPGGAVAARPGGVTAAQPRPLRQVERPTRTMSEQDKPTITAAAHRDVTRSQALSGDPGGDVQRQALELVNKSRRDGGCGGVTVDRRLIRAANEHAADMARRGYFAHESPNGDLAGERVEDAGYEWKRYGENIARGQDSVFEVVKGWMNSPEHRENIMDCKLSQVGVGLAFAPDRTPYWVQDFATPQA